jgi:hypothetical protein
VDAEVEDSTGLVGSLFGDTLLLLVDIPALKIVVNRYLV